MSRKKRSDTKLLSLLNPQQQAHLRTLLVDENKSYQEAQTWLRDEYNVRVGIGAIQRFYASECFALRSSEAKEFAARVEQELIANDATFDKATLALIKQRAFERAYAKNGSIDELQKLAGMIGDSARLALKTKDVALTERRIVLLEQKAAQADAGKAVADATDLSPEEQLARFKQVFGAK